jgi:hypothetical protein
MLVKGSHVWGGKLGSMAAERIRMVVKEYKSEL